MFEYVCLSNKIMRIEIPLPAEDQPEEVVQTVLYKRMASPVFIVSVVLLSSSSAVHVCAWNFNSFATIILYTGSYNLNETHPDKGFISNRPGSPRNYVTYEYQNMS